eukprot:CAMPEP_0172669536 /NCGR_PEP_ID=MMETSP1074-20121228/9742_1 /TAXON_ID=2916 /ORGANISM="Ceratium fusus, Strain PA161109" /LENGTH=135 /DNA_ID=CAMNT_0013486325 /DNA_START=1287 /DNA_END=1691 /DNA_ORIENTATION=-
MSTESKSITLAFRSFTRGHMLVDAVRITTFPKFEPMNTLRHTVWVILVQEIAFVAFHAQSTQPMPADDAMSTPSGRALRCATLRFEAGLAQCIFRVDIRLKVKGHVRHAYICQQHRSRTLICASASNHGDSYSSN